jgi:hypothetical protein
MRRSLIACARKIDHGYTVKFGSLCKDHGVKHFHLLTSMGSNPNSWFLYPKTKGQVLFPLPSLGCSCAVVCTPVRTLERRRHQGNGLCANHHLEAGPARSRRQGPLGREARQVRP